MAQAIQIIGALIILGAFAANQLGELPTDSRLYLVGRRLYSLIVSTLDVGGVSEDVVKKFMDSFKLT